MLDNEKQTGRCTSQHCCNPHVKHLTIISAATKEMPRRRNKITEWPRPSALSFLSEIGHRTCNLRILHVAIKACGTNENRPGTASFTSDFNVHSVTRYVILVPIHKGTEICIWKVPGSNLGRDTDLIGFSWGFSGPPCKFRHIYE
jgi:hypothetical protein